MNRFTIVGKKRTVLRMIRDVAGDAIIKYKNRTGLSEAEWQYCTQMMRMLERPAIPARFAPNALNMRRKRRSDRWLKKG